MSKPAQRQVCRNGKPAEVHQLRWSADSTKLVCGQDTMIRVYDAQSGEQLQVLAGHTGLVQNVAWNPNTDQLASVGLDNSVKTWSLASQNQTQSIPEPESYYLRWSHSGKKLASCQPFEGNVWVFDPETQQRQMIDSDAQRVEQPQWSPDDRRLAYGGQGFLRVRDFDMRGATTDDATEGTTTKSTTTKDITTDFESFHERHVAGQDWSPDGKLLACRTMNTEALIICDSGSGEWKLQQDDIPMRSLQWHQIRCSWRLEVRRDISASSIRTGVSSGNRNGKTARSPR